MEQFRTKDEIIARMRTYSTDVDAELIAKAYDFAEKAHEPQTRASGDPYFIHPAQVAYSLTDYRLDTATIITALLHDTVEDTPVTLEDIKSNFGEDIAFLVKGVTKLNKLEIQSESMKQIENFRKLLLAMSEDLRVLVVKLADRLHNMQTIGYVSDEKAKRVAQETLDIYAPLAERVGMRSFKEKLQDLSFDVLHHEARLSIIKRLDFLRKKGLPEVARTEEKIAAILKEAGVQNAKVSGRQKKPYSIWRKMQEKSMAFEDLADVVAFRAIVEDVGSCYQALGAIHNKFHTIPGRFKDYISTPKMNGYQSIHTSVIGPNQQKIEVQIRTQEMHDIAEYGVAAHWSYKKGDKKANMEGKQYRWLRELLEILEKTDSAEEFQENTAMAFHRDQVFCFTPKGDIIALPYGATPVDFAYAVHTSVGHKCQGVRINGSGMFPLRTKLRNGDQVEIVTQKEPEPKPTWLDFVVTAKARTEIRRFVRTQNQDEYAKLGLGMLQKAFKDGKQIFTEKALQNALGELHYNTLEEVYIAVGQGHLAKNKVFEVVVGVPLNPPKPKRSVFAKFRKEKTDNKLPIKGLVPGMAIHYAGCCHPIPGDNIVGIVTTGRGITIHTLDCTTLDNYSETPERWIEVSWDTNSDKSASYVGRLRVNVNHAPGAIAALANAIAQQNGNINHLKITNRTTDFFEILVDVEVKNDIHMHNVIANIRSKEQINSVERYVG
jgi:GTP diphosphokinase / guanosine-3',5'-bis(diphosphate) 3'-diphosphatase